MGSGGERAHVVHRAGAVVHVGQHQNGDVRRQRSGKLVGLDQFQTAPALAAQCFGNVQIGGKVAALTDDRLALRGIVADQVQGGAENFVQVDRRAVGGDHLVDAGSDQARDFVANAPWGFEPTCAVPAADQAFAPFDIHHGTHARGR